MAKSAKSKWCVLTLAPEELEHLSNALREYMSDEYGQDNEEGAWEPEDWSVLQGLPEKLASPIALAVEE